jgi:hypothetical protein
MRGEYISHCVSVRLRVNGTGNIRTAVFDFGNTNFMYLVDLLMNDNITGRTLTALANFNSELIQAEIRTTAIDEVFRVSRIIPYVKVSKMSYPQ